MPYPNEFSCRIKSPGSFEKGSFRRIAQGRLSIIIGRLKGKKTTTTQAFRYPKGRWDKEVAKKHCQENKGTFHDIK